MTHSRRPYLIGDAAAFLCCKTKQNQWYIELLFQLVCFLLIFDAKFKADFVLTFFDSPSILLVEAPVSPLGRVSVGLAVVAVVET